jgi:hypothetical protein
MRQEQKPCFRQGQPNSFGLHRRYYGVKYPKHDPEQTLELKDFYKPSYNVPSGSHSPTDPSKPLGPFPNLSSFQLGEWYLNAGSDLSLQSLSDLVRIAQNPGFAEDISQVNWKKAFNALSACPDEITGYNDAWLDDDGWKETNISIPLPLKGGMKENIAAGVLHHRSIVSIVRDKIASSTNETFHYEPFELSWQPDSQIPATRVRSELYNSDAFIKAHHDLQNSPPLPGCQRERVVVGLMFWSDETQLTNFSSEGIWPCYLQFANESKYERCKPTSNLAHIVAFFDKVRPFASSSTTLMNLPSSPTNSGITWKPIWTKQMRTPSDLIASRRYSRGSGSLCWTMSCWRQWRMDSSSSARTE